MFAYGRLGKGNRKLGLLTTGLLFAALLSFIGPERASASPDVGKCSEASGTMTCNVSGQSLDFSGLPTMTMVVGNSYTAADVFTSSDSTPIQIDAILTITEVVGGSISKSGGNISSSISGSDTIAFRVDFKTGDGSTVLMENIEVRVDDIDGSDQAERAEFSGLASYTWTDGTHLTASPAGQDLGSSETGTRTFLGGNTASPSENRAVSVLFESVSSIGLKAYDEGTGGVVGFSFGTPNWGSASTATIPVGDGEYTITYDANSADTGSAPAASTARGAQTLAAGTGLSKSAVNISSWNTSADGSGVTLALAQSYTPVADITL